MPEEITLSIDGRGPYGLRIKGGLEFGQFLTVEKVIPGSKGQSAGFCVGDVLLAINDVDVRREYHDTVKEMFTEAKSLKIKLQRGSSFPPGLGSSQIENLKISSSLPPSGSPSIGSYKVSPPAVQAAPKADHYQAPPAAIQTQQTTHSYQLSTAAISNEPKAETIAKTHSGSSTYQKCSADATVPLINTLSHSEAPQSAGYTPLFSDDAKKLESQRICHKCKDAITSSEYLRYMDKVWHSNHFLCEECKVDLSSAAFHEKNDRIMCVPCFKKANAPKCDVCHDYCINQFVTVAGKNYHGACFKCCKCSMALTGEKFQLKENFIYCVRCISDILNIRCSTCSKLIDADQSYVTVENQSHHSSCLKCHLCLAYLGEMKSIMLRDNKPCCPNH
ncbi:PDZ and LIM domain protein 7 [Thelohanellus kitauei]|uniref:PDZ and LIM domain protein 7 n=1 Tax=Thelohanellus kitauei TaxID=669202 RepID=A0A0C2JAI9_THEKT|nr:PDZ and LIM domain protein 7 [Thelohanellus kitauei]